MRKNFFHIILVYFAYFVVLAHNLVPHHHHVKMVDSLAMDQTIIIAGDGHHDEEDTHHLFHSFERYPHAGSGNGDVTVSHSVHFDFAKDFPAGFGYISATICYPPLLWTIPSPRPPTIGVWFPDAQLFSAIVGQRGPPALRS